MGGVGAVRTGGGTELEGPASNPVSGMTGKPVKGLIYGSLSTMYDCCGFAVVRGAGWRGWLGAAVGA